MSSCPTCCAASSGLEASKVAPHPPQWIMFGDGFGMRAAPWFGINKLWAMVFLDGGRANRAVDAVPQSDPGALAHILR